MTTDINLMVILLVDVGVFVSCTMIGLRTAFGPLPFDVVLLYVIFVEIFFTIVFGILNSSAFLQMAIIMNLR